MDGATAYAQRHALYVSYMFAAFGDRMWEFASLIFLMQVFPKTLFWASLFGLMETLAAIVSGPWIGRLVDRMPRLQVVRGSILGQNVSIAFACVVFFFIFEPKTNDVYLYSGYAVITLTAMIAKISSSINKISIHKDWVPVLAASDDDMKIRDAARLTSLNSVMRRIDLTSSIVAPLIAGVLASGVGNKVATVSIGVWAIVSIFIEMLLVQRVWSIIPHLRDKTPVLASGSPSTEETPLLNSTSRPVSKRSYFASWKMYLSHPLCFPSVAYCLLYISILNFGGIMVSFLSTPYINLSPAWVAAGRGIAAFVGVVATIVTPRVIPRLGLVKTGVVMLWMQLLCLIPTVLVFIFPFERGVFLSILFTSLCLSRFGLWGFDLVETQMMQEGVDEDAVGAVNGTQESMMNIMFLVSFLITIVFDDPTKFQYPAFLSAASVAVAAVLFSAWAASARAETGTKARH